MSNNPSRSHSRMASMNGLGPRTGFIPIGSSPVNATGEIINVFQAKSVYVFNTPGEFVIGRAGWPANEHLTEGPRGMGPPPQPSPSMSNTNTLGTGSSVPIAVQSPTTPTRNPEWRELGPVFGINASSQSSCPATVTINGTNGTMTPATHPMRSIVQERSQLTPLSVAIPVASSSQGHAPNESPFCSCVECRPRPARSPASWSSSSSSTLSSDHDRYVSPFCTQQ